jgi:hypothetical protein
LGSKLNDERDSEASDGDEEVRFSSYLLVKGILNYLTESLYGI